MSDITFDQHYNTIVAGSGPAGVMAAIHAAERGSVLLVESSALPRDKSCGGMLNEYSQEFLSAYGTLPDSLFLTPAWVNFRFHDWDRKILRPTELRFANVDRRDFDHWLLSLLPSNVTVSERTALTGFEQTAERVTVQLRLNSSTDTSVTADYLIGCDGPRSTVRRSLGIGSVANYVTLQDFCRLDGELEPYFDCIYTRSISDDFGYAYVIPKGDVAIVGSVLYPKTKQPHVKHDKVLETFREKLPLGPTEKREAWVALSVRERGDVLRGIGRVLLAGEAGGFMSPTSGEGISYALNTGRLAGQAVASAEGDAVLELYTRTTDEVARNIWRKLKWLPFMESRSGKYIAGFVPTSIVSRVTEGL